MLALDQLQHNVNSLRAQIGDVFDRIRSRYNIPGPDPLILDNYEWYEDCNILQFLTRAGGLRISSMLGKDSITTRGASLTYAEFTYQLLQSYDFLHLAETHNCYVQIGGSD